jgi:VIT1/CCC1 family predicted Fe2+/Mn2+ transporter
MTGLAPIIWIVWCVFAGVTAILYLYRSRLTRDEEDQIFLDDSFDHMKAEQAAIVAKVSKVEPMLKVAKWLVIATTVMVISYYVWDVLVHLNVIHS